MRRPSDAPRGAVLALALALIACIAANPPGFAYAAAASPPPPSASSISGDNVILVDVSTGDVLFERRADQARPVASATKLMTALLTLEQLEQGKLKLSSEVPAADYRPAAIESQLGLTPGERMTVADLLRGLLLESANDGAVTLAEAVAGSEDRFVRRMNERARELGLDKTHFTNPIGLDEGRNRSSARDLAHLTLQLRTHDFFRRTVARSQVTLRSGAYPRTIENRNTLVAHELVDGVKTGHTRKAGYVLVASGRSRERSGTPRVRLISVVLGAPSEGDRNDDTMDLLRWGFRLYKDRFAVRRGQPAAAPPVAIKYRRGATLPPLEAGRSVRYTFRSDRAEPKVRTVPVGVPEEVEGPVREGQKLATLRVLVNGKEVDQVPLVASSSVPEASWVDRAKWLLTAPLSLVMLLAVAAAGLVGVRALRRHGARRPAGRPHQSGAGNHG